MNIPFGYKMVKGKLLPDLYQAKVLILTQELVKIGLNEDELMKTFNEFQLPKKESSNFNLEEKWDEILNRGKEILEERTK